MHSLRLQCMANGESSITFDRLSGNIALTFILIDPHRMIFKKLLTSPKSRSEEALSLEEILAEGQEQMPLPRDGHLPDLTNPHYYYNQHFPSGSKHYHSSPQQSICSTPASEENVYMTIDEAMVQSINKRNETASPSLISTSSCSSLGGTHDFSKRQYKVLQVGVPSQLSPHYFLSRCLNMTSLILQEAMYHAAECGFLDIALELRSLGVNWSLHVWSQCLWAAHVLQRKTIIQCLLKDFLASSRHEDLNMEFVNECLPLMCHIFRNSKVWYPQPCNISHNNAWMRNIIRCFVSLLNSMKSLVSSWLTFSLASTAINLSHLSQPWEANPLQESVWIPTSFVTSKASQYSMFRSPSAADPVYVNNPEMSDIQFLIDGKTFHGHKILLVNASSHMRSLLEEARQKTSAADSSSVTRVEIHDIKFKTFEVCILSCIFIFSCGHHFSCHFQTMMMFLYHGGTDNQTLDTREVLDVSMGWM